MPCHSLWCSLVTTSENSSFPRFLLVHIYQQDMHLWDHILPLWPPWFLLQAHNKRNSNMCLLSRLLSCNLLPVMEKLRRNSIHVLILLDKIQLNKKKHNLKLNEENNRGGGNQNFTGLCYSSIVTLMSDQLLEWRS